MRQPEKRHPPSQEPDALELLDPDLLEPDELPAHFFFVFAGLLQPVAGAGCSKTPP
jgi:hypothetical protein